MPETQSSDFEVHADQIYEAGQIYLPRLADEYDGFTTALGDLGKGHHQPFTAPPGGAGGGNEFGEAILDAQLFAYQCFEESADGLRAVGLLLEDAADDVTQTEDEIKQEMEGLLEQVDSGDYESDVRAPTDYQDYDNTTALSRGEEMNRWADQYAEELEG
jgi:hypothetical protein